MAGSLSTAAPGPTSSSQFPTLSRFTPGPIFTISPATSRPMITGSGILIPGIPRQVKTS
jgi:hypothetical protein